MIRRPPRSTRVRSSAASDVYKRQLWQPAIMYEYLGWPFRRIWPLRSMFRKPVQLVSTGCANFVASGGRLAKNRQQLLCMLSWRHGLIIATLFMQELRRRSQISCNECSAPPPEQSATSGSLIVVCRHSCMTDCTGWMCLRGSPSSSALWRTVVCMDKHPGTSPSILPSHWNRISTSITFCQPTPAHCSLPRCRLNTYGRPRAFPVAGPTV